MDLVSREADHDPGRVVGEGVHGGGAQTGGEDAVEGGGGAAGLDVAEGREVGLVAAARVVDELAELLRPRRGALGEAPSATAPSATTTVKRGLPFS